MSIKNTLEKAQKNKIVVSIHTEKENWSRCSVGYVDVITDHYVRLQSLSEYGENNGFEIRALSEIFKVEWGGKYEEKIKKLSEGKGDILSEVLMDKPSSEDLIKDTLKQAYNKTVIVVIFGNDTQDSLVGYITEIKGNLVEIKLINEFGELDGFAAINIDEILHIDFNTKSEQIRHFLYKNNKFG